MAYYKFVFISEDNAREINLDDLKGRVEVFSCIEDKMV